MLKVSSVLVIAVVLAGSLARAQDITVVVTNGKTGHPLPNERVLVFEFDGEPPQHDVSVELHTDAKGLAILYAADIRRKKLQLWVDGRTQCSAHPNLVSFDVAEIRKNGVKGPNTCAGFLDSTMTSLNALEIFARSATRRERMAW